MLTHHWIDTFQASLVLFLRTAKILAPFSHLSSCVIKVIGDLSVAILCWKLLLIFQFLKIHASIDLMTSMLSFGLRILADTYSQQATKNLTCARDGIISLYLAWIQIIGLSNLLWGRLNLSISTTDSFKTWLSHTTIISSHLLLSQQESMSFIIPILQSFERRLTSFNILLQVDYSFFNLSFDFILLIGRRVVKLNLKLLYFWLFWLNLSNDDFSFFDDLLHFCDRL